MINLRRAVLAATLGACATAPTRPTAPPTVAEPTAAEPVETAPVDLRFLEVDGDGWREITDPQRLETLHALADNESARFALALYATAWEVARIDDLPRPTLFVALQPGGNFARIGVEATGAGGQRLALPMLPYLILEEDARSFRTTFLHEGGHALHALLARGAPARDTRAPATPIPHSTAALTDRRTAFEEGFGIHLETVAAHCGRADETAAYYQRRDLAYGQAEGWQAEYYSAARDLLSYAQNAARYHHVRDGLYAFEAAAGGDYLRVQLDPARDLRRLRSAGGLMASEGFVASVLFHLAVGDGCAPLPELADRYRPILVALHAAETDTGALDAVPLIELVAALRTADPDRGGHAVRVFLDLSRGATMATDAQDLWARYFDAALRVDLEGRDQARTAIENARRSWEQAALADPSALAQLVGPVIEVEVPNVRVGIALFGPLQPLRFDLNAADLALLALAPGLDAGHLEAIARERAGAPFASWADFQARTGELGLPAGALVPVP